MLLALESATNVHFSTYQFCMAPMGFDVFSWWLLQKASWSNILTIIKEPLYLGVSLPSLDMYVMVSWKVHDGQNLAEV